MLYLFLTVLLTVSLFIIFRLFKTLNINIFQAVVFNYLTCVITGVLFNINQADIFSLNYNPLLIYALIAGGLFLLTFFLMALTVQKVNVYVSGIANKTALVIPVIFNILFLNREQKVSLLLLSAIAIALIAIVLTSLPEKNASIKIDNKYLWLPLSVFFLGGCIDSGLNFINKEIISTEEQGPFLIMVFGIAGITGFIISFLGKSKITLKNIMAGVALGIPNYFSMYYLLKTLSHYQNNGTAVFPVLNTAVIICTSILAYLVFNDKLTRINLAGILLSLIAMTLFFLSIS